MRTGNLDQQARLAAEKFSARIGREPELVVAAPGRVNLLGGHVDYNDGLVLPMAIERYVVIAASPLRGSRVREARLHSLLYDETVVIPTDCPLKPGGEPRRWTCYLQGVLAAFCESGCAVPAFEAVIDSQLPASSGLSSSAALEIALATLVESLADFQLAPAEKALLCQRAEHEFAGVPCGIMDQFSSVFGRPDQLLLLDCQSRKLTQVALDDPTVTVLVANSKVGRELSGGEYARRRQQCETALGLLQDTNLQPSSWRDVGLSDLEAAANHLPPTEYQRATHVVTEIDRVRQAVTALEHHDYGQFGQLMYASHASLKHSFEVSCPELDLLVDLGREIGTGGGVLGSRMTGAGFGGCTVSLIETNQQDRIQETLTRQYRARTGLDLESFVSRPAAGACVIRNNL